MSSSRLIVVGHGPSVKGKGEAIDRFGTVVRLKRAETGPDHGEKTSIVCARSEKFRQEGIPLWLFSAAVHDPEYPETQVANAWFWLQYFRQFKPKKPKPSTGLCAIFCAAEFLKPKTITLTGFDYLLHPDTTAQGWKHDTKAELKAIKALKIRFRELI